jgi:hypothetical protein
VRVFKELAGHLSVIYFQEKRTLRFRNSCVTFEKQEVCYIFQKLFEVTVSYISFFNMMYILPPQKSGIKKGQQ